MELTTRPSAENHGRVCNHEPPSTVQTDSETIAGGEALASSSPPAIPTRQNGPCLGYLSAGPGHWLCYQNVTGVSARKNNAAEGTVAPR